MSDEYTPTEHDVRMRWYGEDAWLLSEEAQADMEAEFDRFIAQVKAEALEGFKAHIDASPAVLWIWEGGVKERIIARADEYRSGERV